MALTLSVVTITKDDAEGWRSTVDSLLPLHSSAVAWEHIVIDGSEPALLADVTPEWPLVLHRAPPTGIYRAMNLGLERARGDVVWFLNGGDRLRDVEALKRVLALFASDPTLDLVCAAADLVSKRVLSYVSFPRTTLHSSLVSGRSLCHQAMLYRRTVFDDLGPYSTRYPIAGDEEFLVRFYLSRRKSLCVADRLVFFDTSGVSYRRYGQRYRELAALSRRLMRGNVRPLDYARYAWHRRLSSARAHFFGLVRRLPFTGWLRGSWLAWRRLTLTYR
jgi:glycosyltransferase involved in cell wall biosynthesis